jgi:hypothetical protein
MTSTRSNGARLQVEQLEGRETPAILFGLTTNNVLVTFDSAQSRELLRATPIFGLAQLDEVLTDIDVRTTNGLLYGHSNQGRLYQIDPLAGQALLLGSANPLPSVNVGFDFDPKADLIRILGNRGENIVREPIFGLFVRRANDLFYAPGDSSEGIAPRVTGAAFFNNVPNPPFRLLYAIDHGQNALVRVGRNTIDEGLLTTIGSLGRDVTSRVGLDIAPETNAMFASLQTAGQTFSRLYHISYATGRANPVGRIGDGLLLNDIAIDLIGTSGFTSQAGFGVLGPPISSGIGFGSSSFNTFAVPQAGFTPISFPTFISPSGGTFTTTPGSPSIEGSNGSRIFF